MLDVGARVVLIGLSLAPRPRSLLPCSAILRAVISPRKTRFAWVAAMLIVASCERSHQRMDAGDSYLDGGPKRWGEP